MRQFEVRFMVEAESDREAVALARCSHRALITDSATGNGSEHELVSEPEWHSIAESVGVYATTGWMVADVKAKHPDLNDDECLEFIDQNAKYIVEAMVRGGWDAIECFPLDRG